MRANLVLVGLIVAATLPACARIVVLDPELAAQKNSKDWTVKSEPGKGASSLVPAAAPAPAPKATAPAEGSATKKR